jgi:hypothetical protein
MVVAVEVLVEGLVVYISERSLECNSTAAVVALTRAIWSDQESFTGLGGRGGGRGVDGADCSEIRVNGRGGSGGGGFGSRGRRRELLLGGSVLVCSVLTEAPACGSLTSVTYL